MRKVIYGEASPALSLSLSLSLFLSGRKKTPMVPFENINRAISSAI